MTGCSVYNTGSYSYIAYPSPASSILIVNLEAKTQDIEFSIAKKTQAKSYKIYLYDDKGSVVRQQTSDGSQISNSFSKREVAVLLYNKKVHLKGRCI